jgi:hypothetical protein
VTAGGGPGRAARPAVRTGHAGFQPSRCGRRSSGPGSVSKAAAARMPGLRAGSAWSARARAQATHRATASRSGSPGTVACSSAAQNTRTRAAASHASRAAVKTRPR